MKPSMKFIGTLSVIAFGAIVATPVHATQYVVRVDGPDAIFLAGRTDLSIPAANLGWAGGMIRHGGPTPEEALEQLPPSIPVTGGDVVQVSDPASGGINFFNGFGPPFFGPEGNNAASSLSSFGGISGYIGLQGALAGVFLDNSVPSSGPAPATLNFGTAASRDFTTLSPGLGQVFFIGDGLTSLSALQSFIAPSGATRLFFGIPDGFGFNGAPGAYDDNDGAYRISVGVNERPSNRIPDGGAGLSLALGSAGLLLLRRRFGR